MTGLRLIVYARKTFASAIKRPVQKTRQALLPGILEHENRAQLNPE